MVCMVFDNIKMAAVLDEVGKSAEKLVDEQKNDMLDEEDETGAVEASKKKKKKKKKKQAGKMKYRKFYIFYLYEEEINPCSR